MTGAIEIEPLTVTVAEAKRITGIGHTTLYRLIAAGELKTVKIGRRTLVTYASIKAVVSPATLNVAATL